MIYKDNKNRCKWCNPKNELYIKYHDEEWGQPSYEDKYLFEMLILESFQAGLSWECVLNKREAFIKVFDNFDIDKICNFDDKKIKELLENPNIIRNKLKINAAINNSKIFKEIQKEYPKVDIKLTNEEKYTIVEISTKVNIITPGLNRVLGNPYIVKVERKIPNVEDKQ